MPKLYVCTVTIEYIALTEDAVEARDFARDAVSDTSYYAECTDVQVMRASTPLPAGCFGETLVYHNGDEDISLDTALERYPLTKLKAKTPVEVSQPCSDSDHTCFMVELDPKRLVYPCSGDGWYRCPECCCFHPTKIDK